jgi:hypothetical protein
MKTFIRTFLMIATLQVAAHSQGMFDQWFMDATLRVDLHHSGTKGEERITLDDCRKEGIWPGHRINRVDTLNLGEYLCKVVDKSTNALIYSRGYSTYFNEWQTTEEAARGVLRTFSESIRMPYPRRAVQLTVSRRDRRMEFHEIFSTVIDPTDPTQIHKEQPVRRFPMSAVLDNGAPADKVDLLVLGDGYASEEMGKFKKDVDEFVKTLFATEPFASRKRDFNVWRIDVVSPESGIDIPDLNVWKNNPLGTHYNTFGSARYVLTEENKTLRDIAAAAPYDFIMILVNDSRYGGGGIFNLYATTYTHELVKGQEWQSDYMTVHEFGHSFAGLGDEYYTSSTGYIDFYLPGVEPWEPNVTASKDGGVKWSALLTPGIALPTPWEKAAYDSVEALRGKLNRLASDYYEKRKPLYDAEMSILATSRFKGMVGIFEGAGYASKGLYRPSVNCRMFSLSMADFDPVCRAAVERMIDLYSSGGK